jgi:hypothetical protein
MNGVKNDPGYIDDNVPGPGCYFYCKINQFSSECVGILGYAVTGITFGVISRL